jgi:hypothetical protein
VDTLVIKMSSTEIPVKSIAIIATRPRNQLITPCNGRLRDLPDKDYNHWDALY